MKIVKLCSVVFLALFTLPAFAVVDTSFDGPALDGAISLDIPNGALASFTLDSANGELDVATTGNTDLWVNRNNSPFAWTAAPVVAPGHSWFAETEIRYDTDVSTSRTRVAGITVYGGPDGSGGSSQGMDFSFGINNWDDRGNPGYQASVEVQGLGDNRPGDLGSNLTALSTNQSAFLRMVVTENGGSDFYEFFYKLAANDAWTPLGSMNSSVANSRVALFFKNSGSTSAPDRSGSFTYFLVGNDSKAIPAVGASGLLVLMLLIATIGVIRLKAA